MSERGLRIYDVYVETGIFKTMLMAISENNKKGVQFDIVDKLCNFLGVIPCEFFEYSPYIVKVNFSNDNIDNYDNGLHNIEINIKIKITNEHFI